MDKLADMNAAFDKSYNLFVPIGADGSMTNAEHDAACMAAWRIAEDSLKFPDRSADR